MWIVAAVFVKDGVAIPYTLTDTGTKEHPLERVESFRQQISSGTEEGSRGAVFRSPEDLRSHVLKAYFHRARRNELLRPKPIEGRPYPGLRAFRPDEADRFFGRDVETDALIERLLGRGERFLALIEGARNR